MQNKATIIPPPSTLDSIVEICSWIVIGFIWISIALNYSELPELIPKHYNVLGNPDSFGNKLSLIFLAGIASFLSMVLSAIMRYPQSFNYPVTITSENEVRQYSNAIQMIRYLKLFLSILFCTLVIKTILIAKGSYQGLGVWFLPVVLVCLFLPIVYFISKAFRLK